MPGDDAGSRRLPVVAPDIARIASINAVASPIPLLAPVIATILPSIATG
jgi:hypothetical protein